MEVKGLATALFVSLAVSACAHHKADYRDFTHPLPNPPRACLGDLTQSPERDQTLSPQALYNCARDLYRWALDFDCPNGNRELVRQQTSEALENLLAIPEGQRPEDFDNLRNAIETLNSEVDCGYCG